MMSVSTSVKNSLQARVQTRWSDMALVRLSLLVLLFTVAAARESRHLSALFNNDVWWHLRTGIWILEHHAVPHNGLFSQYSDLPWIASSWGYDVLIAAAYKLFGLRAIPMLLMGFKLALAGVTFLLARGWGGNFWTAVLLSAVTQYVLVDLQPTPNLFSIVLLAVELMLLLECRRSGDVRLLFWMPLLFLLWTNLDIQFVIGLFVMAWFLSVLFTEQILRRSGVTWINERQLALPLATAGAVTGVAMGSTLVNPYWFHLFQDVFKNAYSEVSFRYFDEMRAMSFRRPQHYVLLLLVMAAFLALGRQRSRDLFKLGIMIAGSLVAFRIQRDTWCIVLPSVAILADALRAEPRAPAEPAVGANSWKWEKLLLSVMVLAVFVAAASRIPGDNALMHRLGGTFPVKAGDFIRENHLPQPLFNAYKWGGFLTWYLPQYPVAMDRRVDLYGEDLTEQHFKVTGGSQRLDQDPSFSRAQTILLERDSGMARALTTLPALTPLYRMLYSDDVAMVLARR
jgi:hypothetical protein